MTKSHVSFEHPHLLFLLTLSVVHSISSFFNSSVQMSVSSVNFSTLCVTTEQAVKKSVRVHLK